MMINDEDILAI